jgi:mRNA interferase HigB
LRKNNFANFAELRAVFPHADLVGKAVAFNIGGNKARLVANIRYDTGIVYVLYVLTHKEYDKGKWKE